MNIDVVRVKLYIMASAFAIEKLIYDFIQKTEAAETKVKLNISVCDFEAGWLQDDHMDVSCSGRIIQFLCRSSSNWKKDRAETREEKMKNSNCIVPFPGLAEH